MTTFPIQTTNDPDSEKIYLYMVSGQLDLLIESFRYVIELSFRAVQEGTEMPWMADMQIYVQAIHLSCKALAELHPPPRLTLLDPQLTKAFHTCDLAAEFLQDGIKTCNRTKIGYAATLIGVCTGQIETLLEMVQQLAVADSAQSELPHSATTRLTRPIR